MIPDDRPGPFRVLITGVTRTIGRQLAEELYFDNRVENVLGVSVDPRRPYYFRDYDPQRFAYQQLDLNRHRSISDFFHGQTFLSARINSVVHLAFRSDPRHYDGSSHRLNVEGTRTFLDYCLACPTVEQFVYLSTANVYRLGPQMDVLVSEKSELNLSPAVHPIIGDAVAAELLCRAQMDHERCRIVVLRPSGTIGRNVRSELNALFESVICFTPFGYDPMVNPIHARDVVRALKTGLAAQVRGVFNIAGPDVGPLSVFLGMSQRRVVTVPGSALGYCYRAARRFGMTSFDYEVNPLRLQYSLVLDASEARRQLGISPRHHIKFG